MVQASPTVSSTGLVRLMSSNRFAGLIHLSPCVQNR